MKEANLVYDWSKYSSAKRKNLQGRSHTYIEDESLRDGLQGTSATRPGVEEQKIFLEFLTELGIEYANIGFPASGERQKIEASELVRHTIQNGLNIALTCATRALREDIKPILDISVSNGDFPLEAGIFLGSSRLRSLANKWNRRELITLTKNSVSFAKKHGLPVMFITEDSTRAHPADLRELYRVALDCGADRICIADTVGISNEKTTRNVIRFVLEEVAAKYPGVKVDWHGHNDRGLAVANCIIAAEEGIDRIHATTLCIGERSGNVDLAQLILNLNLEGFRSDNLTRLQEFAEYSSKIFEMSIPANAPVIGKDTDGTSSGVHADAILKALEQGNPELASRVYSAYDPAIVGRKLDIRVGPMSGDSNAIYVLKYGLGIEATPERIRMLMEAAKNQNNKILSLEEVASIVQGVQNKNLYPNKLPKNFSVEGISLADYTIISAGLQFNIFEEIASGNNTFKGLSEKVPPEILRALLDALSTFGYVMESGNELQLTKSTQQYLLKNSLSNIIALFENSDWYLLPVEAPRALKEGAGVTLRPETYNGIIDISERIGQDVQKELTEDFPQLLTEELEVLDLGSGKMGVFAEIGRQNKRLKITAVERNPYAVQHLRQLQQAEFGNQLRIVESDITQVEGLHTNYDFIYLSHLLHWVKDEQIDNLVEFCAEKLSANGVLVVHEDYLSNSSTSPKESVRKNLILSLLGYRIPTKEEIEQLLARTGLQTQTKVVEDRRLLIYARNSSTA